MAYFAAILMFFRIAQELFFVSSLISSCTVLTIERFRQVLQKQCILNHAL